MRLFLLRRVGGLARLLAVNVWAVGSSTLYSPSLWFSSLLAIVTGLDRWLLNYCSYERCMALTSYRSSGFTTCLLTTPIVHKGTYGSNVGLLKGVMPKNNGIVTVES